MLLLYYFIQICQPHKSKFKSVPHFSFLKYKETRESLKSGRRSWTQNFVCWQERYGVFDSPFLLPAYLQPCDIVPLSRPEILLRAFGRLQEFLRRLLLPNSERTPIQYGQNDGKNQSNHARTKDDFAPKFLPPPNTNEDQEYPQRSAGESTKKHDSPFRRKVYCQRTLQFPSWGHSAELSRSPHRRRATWGLVSRASRPRIAGKMPATRCSQKIGCRAAFWLATWRGGH